jgi:hypothetical protein
MKPTKQLIRALRETAHKLRNGEQYNWRMVLECNCGLLAQTLLAVDGDELVKGLFENRDIRESPDIYWTTMARLACPTTGVPLCGVFRALHEAGIETADYERIEYGAGTRPSTVAAWMDREADELERRRIAERADVKEAK